MAKTQEELNQLKSEYESLTHKLKELTDEELVQVTGGTTVQDGAKDDPKIKVRGGASLTQNSEPLYMVDQIFKKAKISIV